MRSGEVSRTTLDRALAVLAVFSAERPRLTLAEITRRVGLPHSTCHRIVGELAGWGALERDDSRGFTIGLRLWELGTLAPRALSLQAAAAPFMEDLYEATRQHVQLAILDGTEAVVVERRSAADAVGIVSGVGGRLPLHCTGVGQVLLAHAGQELFARVVEQGLERFTERTIVSGRALRAALAQCRLVGYATVRGERSPGVDSVAAKVSGRNGTVVGALSVVCQTPTDVRSLGLAVVAAGRGISRSLGGL
ncbi:IclR family transcriptional regulator [Parafrigoribacterium mesophilum]|uniref:IclR family transcriptional regulator n=1 Tax=Parafrigoribacterium mesophilum TaxID=433646 RepID=UPI0031FD87C6